MSAEGSFSSIVSPDELDALLTNARADHPGAGSMLRTIGLTENTHGQTAEIAKRFAVEQGRSLSTLHQTPIRFRFSHWEEISLRQFAGAMLSTDRVARVDIGHGGEDVFFLLNRPLVFGWMMLDFGSRPGQSHEILPSRAYTRIEERFIERAAENLAGIFSKSLPLAPKERIQVLSIEDPIMLQSLSKRPYRVISLDVEGFDEPGVVRIALPLSLTEESQAQIAGPDLSNQPSELAHHLYDAPIEIRAELGFAEIALSEVARLSVGDELTLQRTDGDGLIIHVEDTPKFRAEPGKIGTRLAVRITDVIKT